MDLPFFDEDRLRASLGMLGAVDTLETTFGTPLPTTPGRTHLDVGTGDLLLMPAWGDSVVGVKLVTVAAGNAAHGKPLVQGVYVLFEKASLSPIALFDGAALTALRTAAVSAVATRHLARPDSNHLVMFGAGAQARSHLIAMAAVRDIRTVTIVSRTPERARELVAFAEKEVDARMGSAASVSEADIICACTSSAAPVLDGSLLPPGTHINAVGSFKPSARELDDSAIASGRIVVDTPVALDESGDLAVPIASGLIHAQDIEELAVVVSENRTRSSDSERTIFKSVGSAFEDLVVAEAAARLA